MAVSRNGFYFGIDHIEEKNTWEDIFLNVSAPVTVLLILRNSQYHLSMVIIILTLAINVALSKMIDIWFCGKYEHVSKRKKARLCYYNGRKWLGILLIILLTPLTVWTAHNEYYNEEAYLRLFSSDAFGKETEENIPNEWTVVREDEWDNLATNSRFDEFTKMTSYFLHDLGCSSMKVYAYKELTDGMLAYYSDNTESISVNIIYLDTCSYREALHVAAHECRHCMQHQAIKAINILEEAGMDCKDLEIFSELYALKEAKDNYAWDSLKYDSYTNNLIEQDSEEYAYAQEEKMEKTVFLGGE